MRLLEMRLLAMLVVVVVVEALGQGEPEEGGRGWSHDYRAIGTRGTEQNGRTAIL